MIFGSNGYRGQAEWCSDLLKYKVVCIETGNMLGKDYWVAGIVLWWLWTRPYSLIFVTGPGQTSIGGITWKEIRRAIQSCPYSPDQIPAKITTGVKTSPHIVEVKPGWQALGFSTTSIERMSGQHAGDLLVVVEEASGVEDEIWEAIHSLGASKLVAIGNPLRAEGGFVDLCNQASTDAQSQVPSEEAVCYINVPSTASPHAADSSSPVGLASRGWIEQQHRLWGGPSAFWCQSHIYAVRPRISSQQLIPDEWLDWANQYQRPAVPPNHPIHRTRRIAIDLGEGVGRDETVILVRDDWGILECDTSNTCDLADAAQRTAATARTWKVDHDRISYDAAGIGKNFHNYLVRAGITIARKYFGSNRATDDRGFNNVRSECAWRLQRRLDPDRHIDDRFPTSSRQPPFSIPNRPWWAIMREDLKALTYDLVGSKTRLISKKDLLEQLGRSPDRGDALIQSFAWDEK